MWQCCEKKNSQKKIRTHQNPLKILNRCIKALQMSYQRPLYALLLSCSSKFPLLSCFLSCTKNRDCLDIKKTSTSHTCKHSSHHILEKPHKTASPRYPLFITYSLSGPSLDLVAYQLHSFPFCVCDCSLV